MIVDLIWSNRRSGLGCKLECSRKMLFSLFVYIYYSLLFSQLNIHVLSPSVDLLLS